MARGSDSESREVEATLLLWAVARDAAIAAWLRMDGVEGYRFGPMSDLWFRDRYFDTPEGGLGEARYALRLRQEGAKVRLALKGPAREVAGGARERVEMEDSWSGGFLRSILSTLRDAGVRVPDPVEPAGGIPPGTALGGLGLVKIQERALHRRRRDVFEEEKTTETAVAEIALDAVRYELRARSVLHHEIEVEGIGAEAAVHVGRITGGLETSFGNDIRRWEYGKLRTGIALELLEREGRLDALLDDRDRVLRDAYVQVEAAAGS